ncbi:hypothetical protein QCA50_010286 [Cerrena zonata]|uniref:Aminoglycoside phosphotransferase domain-containing protein n=1 Tax=Cerrena zonata TaxID=2478898 RepID=A0AAW0GAQ6_9APHY
MDFSPNSSNEHSMSVEWVSSLSGTQPRWATEPSLTGIEELVRRRLQISSEAYKVSFFAEGGFNKLYQIKTTSLEYLVRIALPVDYRWKTLSEVATLDFVRRHGTELVPKVFEFDVDISSPENIIGFEWIIMEKLPGVSLEERWQELTWDAKEGLIKTIVSILAKLFDHPLSTIGNIYPQPNTTPTSNTPTVGRIVSMVFFWNKHATQDVNRGPFRSSHDWLVARLAFVLADAAETLQTSEDEDDQEEAVESQQLASRLLRLLPSLFPPHPDIPEQTIICHDDLSFHNLLVDGSGKLTGIVDWECVSALPLWKACQLPAFLQGSDRTDRPDPASYSLDKETGLPGQLFYEHVREWEKSRLREVFLEEMERVRPAWVKEYRAGQKYADFDLAVQCCDDEFARKSAKRWVDYMEQQCGETDSRYVSLRSQLLE